MSAMELAGREFAIVEVDGVPVLASSSPDIAFGADGRVSGRATVNRLMGQFTQDGDVLRFGALATTMMAGPPEHMEQEQRVLAALSGDLTVEEDDDGGVRLVSDAGAVVLAPKPSMHDAGLA